MNIHHLLLVFLEYIIGVTFTLYGEGPAILLSPEVTIVESLVQCLHFDTKLITALDFHLADSLTYAFAILEVFTMTATLIETYLQTWSITDFNLWEELTVPLPPGTYRLGFKFTILLSKSNFAEFGTNMAFWLSNVTLSDENCTYEGGYCTLVHKLCTICFTCYIYIPHNIDVKMFNTTPFNP